MQDEVRKKKATLCRTTRQWLETTDDPTRAASAGAYSVDASHFPSQCSQAFGDALNLEDNASIIWDQPMGTIMVDILQSLTWCRRNLRIVEPDTSYLFRVVLRGKVRQNSVSLTLDLVGSSFFVNGHRAA